MNLEGVEAYSDELQRCVSSLAGGQWGLLAVFREGGMLIGAARERMKSSVRQQQAAGRCAVAAVYLESEGAKSFFVDRLQRWYEEVGECFAVFDDELEARQWLLERIAEANQQQNYD